MDAVAQSSNDGVGETQLGSMGPPASKVPNTKLSPLDRKRWLGGWQSTDVNLDLAAAKKPKVCLRKGCLAQSCDVEWFEWELDKHGQKVPTHPLCAVCGEGALAIEWKGQPHKVVQEANKEGDKGELNAMIENAISEKLRQKEGQIHRGFRPADVFEMMMTGIKGLMHFRGLSLVEFKKWRGVEYTALRLTVVLLLPPMGGKRFQGVL
jgi:hypothetical protein